MHMYIEETSLTFLHWWEHGVGHGDGRCVVFIVCLTALSSWTMNRTGYFRGWLSTILTEKKGGREREREREREKRREYCKACTMYV